MKVKPIPVAISNMYLYRVENVYLELSALRLIGYQCIIDVCRLFVFTSNTPKSNYNLVTSNTNK